MKPPLSSTLALGDWLSLVTLCGVSPATVCHSDHQEGFYLSAREPDIRKPLLLPILLSDTQQDAVAKGLKSSLACVDILKQEIAGLRIVDLEHRGAMKRCHTAHTV